MNFTTIFCCYVLLPYFASLVSPPQEAITCYASVWNKLASHIHCKTKLIEAFSKEPVDKSLYIPKVPLDDKFFHQNKTHFDFTVTNTWAQRYLIYDNHYGGNGVIFIQIGTDDEITAWNMQNGRWSEYCIKAKALCIGIVHRGYGKSLFYGCLSDSSINYINSDQVLADVAWFIYNFRDLHTDYKFPEKLTWIAYGIGRHGTLAAWLRMKYPHLVHAVLSLSAPVLAKEINDDYFKIIDTELLDKEKEFKDEISKAYLEIQNQINDKKFQKIGELFNFCNKHSLEGEKNRKKNIEFMYFLFAHTVGTIMKYGNDVMEFMKNKAINIMLDTKDEYRNLGSPIKRFAHLIKVMLKKYDKSCLQISYRVAKNGYKTLESGHQNLAYLLAQIFGNRSHLYQSCFEFGQFETFDNFFRTSIDLTFYTDFCRDVFGKQYSNAFLKRIVNRTNTYYGGLSIVVSRVIFVYGSNDPYRKLGMTDRVPEKSVTRILEGASYCYELDKVKGVPGLNELKQDILLQLLDWLKENDGNNGDVHMLSDGSGRYENDKQTKFD